MNLWKKVEPSLAKGEKISAEDTKKFDSIGESIETTLKGLRDYNVNWAEKLIRIMIKFMLVVKENLLL